MNTGSLKMVTRHVTYHGAPPKSDAWSAVSDTWIRANKVLGTSDILRAYGYR